MLPHIFVEHHESRKGDWVPDYSAVATHVVQTSGLWSQVVPPLSIDDIVRIPSGISVTYDAKSPSPFRALAIEGTLTFEANSNTKLTVGTIEVYPSGSFIIESSNRVEVVFEGKLNIDDDPGQFSIGLLAIGGTVDICGVEINTVALKHEGSLAGKDQVRVIGTHDWKVGDRLFFPDDQVNVKSGVIGFISKHEVGEIESISGNVLTLVSPLKYNHTSWSLYPEHRPYIAHITRSVVLRSGSASKGHTMMMGSTHAHICHTAFIDLGRTTVNALHDTLRDASGNITRVGTNQRGRYPLHAHHTMMGFTFEGNAVINDPQLQQIKWGITTHDAFGTIRKNVVIGSAGAGIVGEEGSETGVIEENMVIGLGGGSGIKDQDRLGVLFTDLVKNVPAAIAAVDLGHGGFGYWFHGPLLDLKGNIAAGFFRLRPYTFWLDFLPTTSLLPDIDGMPVQYKGKTLRVQMAPLHNFENNLSDGVYTGGLLIYNSRGNSRLKDFTMYVRTLKGNGLHTNYSGRLTLNNVQLFGNRSGSAMSAAHGPGFDILGGRVEGFDIGLDGSKYWLSGTIKGVYLNNAQNLVTVRRANFALEDVRFGVNQINIKLDMSRELKDINRPKGSDGKLRTITDDEYIVRLLRLHTKPNRVIVRSYNGIAGDDFMVDPAELSADYVIPRLGITNQQLWDKHGRQNPNEVVLNETKPGIIGRVGPIQSTGRLIVLDKTTPVYTTSLGYTYSYTIVEDGKRLSTVLKQKAQLQQGFNKLTVTSQGNQFNIFVYADV